MTVSPATRRKARHYAMQALYKWQMTGTAPYQIEVEFRTEYDMKHVDVAYFHQLLDKIPNDTERLDGQYAAYLQDRDVAELDHITRALLWIATYEFLERIDVPYRVVINEAVSLGKKFGATDSYKFINGVLDQLAPVLRAVEVKAC